MNKKKVSEYFSALRRGEKAELTPELREYLKLTGKVGGLKTKRTQDADYFRRIGDIGREKIQERIAKKLSTNEIDRA